MQSIDPHSPGLSVFLPPAYSPAGFWRRVLASIIDGSIVGIMTFPISILGKFAPLVADLDSIQRIIFDVSFQCVAMMAGFFYYGLFNKYRGATPGKLVLGMRVLHNDSGTYLGLWRTLLRDYLGKLCCGLTLGIGFLMVAFRKDKRGLHDFISNTRVLRVHDGDSTRT